MREFPTDPREWLWNDAMRLVGATRLRWIQWTSLGLDPKVRACRDNFAFLGQERHFHDAAAIEAVLDLICDALKLDTGVIDYQRRFFKSLFQSFYSDSEAPAWLTVLGARLSFAQRMGLITTEVFHRVQPLMPRFRIGQIERDFLPLNDQKVSLENALFCHRTMLPDARLRMQEVVVHRQFGNDGLGPISFATERWFLLTSPSRFEREQLRKGRNPTIEEYRDPETGMQTAPLVSLSRFDHRGRHIVGRCVCLRPYVGEIIDLRSVRYKPDYFYRSDRTNHWVLQDLLIPGTYEYF